MNFDFQPKKSFEMCKSVEIKRIKTEVSVYYPIGPKIGTSVGSPSRKSTDHGLTEPRIPVSILPLKVDTSSYLFYD